MDGSIPPKKNSKQIFRRKGKTIVIPSERHKIWHERTYYALVLQRNNSAFNFPIEKCVSITTHIRYPDKRGRDNTNAVESVHDILVDVGILKDDCWQVTGTTTQIPSYDKKDPGATIVIVLDSTQDVP